MTTTSTERVRAMRERRRKALDAADAAEVALRPADTLLGPAVEQTLAALGLEDSDGAAAQLARQYANVIDQAKDRNWSYRWLGPELLRCLEALNGTPAARAKLRKGPPGPQVPSRLDQLRAARSKRP